MGLLSALRSRSNAAEAAAPSSQGRQGRRTGRRRASAQTAFLTVETIDEDVVCLEGSRFRAVLEVAGVNFGLRGDLDQEALVGGYAAFLNGLTFPIQILVRGTPIDVDSYLGALEQRARYDLPEQLAALARDHALFLRRLARNRSLLERRFYVVVPAEAGASPASEWGTPSTGTGPWWWPFGARLGSSSPATGAASAAAARKQLLFRCEEVQRQLARCGLAVRRLRSVELAQLYYACWCPELARLQRLRGQLDDYTSLVVGATGRQSTMFPTPSQPAATGPRMAAGERSLS